MILRLLSLTMTAFFAFATIAQFNDPDPIRWAVAYGVVTLLSAAAVVKRYFFWPTAAAFAASSVWALIRLPSLGEARLSSFSTFGMSSLEDELARETVGLLICVAWTATLLWVMPGGIRRRFWATSLLVFLLPAISSGGPG